jgi:hypothetical protein
MLWADCEEALTTTLGEPGRQGRDTERHERANQGRRDAQGRMIRRLRQMADQ